CHGPPVGLERIIVTEDPTSQRFALRRRQTGRVICVLALVISAELLGHRLPPALSCELDARTSGDMKPVPDRGRFTHSPAQAARTLLRAPSKVNTRPAAESTRGVEDEPNGSDCTCA